MLKTLKRKIALVAVAALGAGGLTIAVAPVANADAIPAAVTGSIETLRKDDTTYVATIGAGTGTGVTITATETAANDLDGNKVKVGYRATSTSTEIAISTVNAAGAPAAAGTETETLATGVTLSFVNGTAGTNTFGAPTDGVYTVAGTANSTANNTIVLNLARNAIPGIYTLYTGTAAGNLSTAGTFRSDSIVVTNAPTTITVRKAGSTTATSATLTGDGTQNYDVKVTDGSRPTYLIGSERIDFAVTGGSGSGVTITTPALSSIGSGDLTPTTGTAANSNVAPNYAATLTAATAAGTYTLTASAFGWTATAATGTLTAVSTANVKNATKLEWSGATTASADDNAYTATLDSDSTPGATTTNLAGAAVENFIPTSVRTLKFKATFAAGTTGDAQFTIKDSTLTDLTNGTVNLVAIDANATAEITYTVTNANAGEAVLVEVVSAAVAGQVLAMEIKYANAATGKVTISPDAADIAVKSASEVTLGATVVDIFGRPFPLQTVTLSSTAGSRNASLSRTEVTDASGVVSFKYTDASTSTTNLQDVVTIASGGLNDAINVNFAGDTTPATVTLVAQQPTDPGAAGQTVTYATTITTSTTRSVTVDTDLANTDVVGSTATAVDEQIADQVLLTATVKNAAGTNVSGVPVVWTGSNGVWFLAGNTPGNVANTATLSGKTTITNYTAAGTAAAQVSFTKAGTATITAKSGDITATWTITVRAGAAGIVTASANGAVVTATVTDLFGNAVSGVDVTFAAATGATLGAGTSSISGKTNATGVVTAVASAVTAGDYAIATSITGGDSAKAADTTNGMPAGAASASATAKVAASSEAASAETAAIKADVTKVSDSVKTLQNAVSTIQASVSELTSTFTSQIKTLSAAIAKISKAIAALSKRIK